MMDYAIGSDKWPGLSKVLEEMGEVGQVLGKLVGAGGEINHWDGSNLAHRTEQELGDLLGSIEFFIESNPDRLRADVIYDRRKNKLNKFRGWHKDMPPLPGPMETTGFIEPVDQPRPPKSTGSWEDVWDKAGKPTPDRILQSHKPATLIILWSDGVETDLSITQSSRMVTIEAIREAAYKARFKTTED